MGISTISIKWKILSLALLGPIIVAGILAWQRINDIRSGAEEALISKSAGIVLIAEATRDQMAKKLHSGVIKPFDQLTSANMSTVAAATEQAATNIALVSTATEEMTSTINGIVKSTEKAHKINKIAVKEASSASEKVDELGRAAIEIGKGFAVVANEIEELAKLTAGTTGEIKIRINSIQESTEATVKQIQQITQVIGEVNDIVTSIVTAVDEQSATTREIAENIGQASTGIQEVTENVSQSQRFRVSLLKILRKSASQPILFLKEVPRRKQMLSTLPKWLNN